MDPLDRLIEAAKSAPRRIVLAEGQDARVAQAGVRAARDGLARVTLIGAARKVREAAGEGVEAVEIVDPADTRLRPDLEAAYLDLRRARGAAENEARAALDDPLNFAALMVRGGHADGTVAGAVATTADTIRAALRLIGRGEGVKTVSSFFLMVLPDGRPLIFADCGLTVEPDAAQLADIAVASAESWRALIGADPKVAMLSFSTMGSAKHERVSKVTEALALAREHAPALAIDGEMQFDAAFVPEVGAAKAPGSSVAGQADVFVFPNLESGNIGYKIAQRIGGAKAIGPVLQGLAHPANDLSRGCTADDVYHMIAVTVAQANSNRKATA